MWTDRYEVKAQRLEQDFFGKQNSSLLIFDILLKG